MRIRLNWWLVFAFYTIHGLLYSAYQYLEKVARAHDIPFSVPFIEEMTGNYACMLLFPLIVVLVQRFNYNSSRWLSIIPIYLLSVMLFSLAHTTLNWFSRALLFPLFGLGPYDYGIMPVRYLMEFPSDVFAFSLMAGSVYGIDYYTGSEQRKLEAAQLESRLAHAQLQNLRLQLQPHFLFNALNTISSVMYEDVTAADEMIARLSEFLRLTLTESPRQEVRLAEELHFLNLYIHIMRARFESALEVRMEIERGLEDALVPQLLLQPLVENSIRHGAEPRSGKVEIDVTAKRADQALHLEVRDRGRGLLGEARDMLKRGIGLANTADRLNKLYGAGHRLAFQNAPDGGLLVSVQIPYHC